MSIWIGKELSIQEKFVRLVTDNLLMIHSTGERANTGQPLVILESMNGHRYAMDRDEFFKTFDRTEHVDFLDAYFGG